MHSNTHLPSQRRWTPYMAFQLVTDWLEPPEPDTFECPELAHPKHCSIHLPLSLCSSSHHCEQFIQRLARPATPDASNRRPQLLSWPTTRIRTLMKPRADTQSLISLAGKQPTMRPVKLTKGLWGFPSISRKRPHKNQMTISSGQQREKPRWHKDCSWITTLQVFLPSMQNAVNQS